MSDEKVFKAIKSVEKEFDRYEDLVAKETINLIEDARKEIVLRLSTTKSEYVSYVYQNTKADLERVISQLKEAYRRKQLGFLDESWKLGIESVDAPFRVTGITGMAQVYLDEKILVNLKEFSADLITNLTSDALKQINMQLRMGSLAGDSVFTIAQKIGTNLTGPSIFKSIKARAEAITRTELNRIYNTAADARFKDIEERDPDVEEMWTSAGDSNVRPHHQAASGQVIKPSEKFKVGDYMMDRPGDPAAPASETVHCRCKVIAYKSNWDINWEKHLGKQPYKE